MVELNGKILDRASALATWIVIQVLERNDEYFVTVDEDTLELDSTRLQEANHYLNSSFDLRENGMYLDAFRSIRHYLAKLLVVAPSIIKNDPDLMEALSELAILDKDGACCPNL